MPTAEVATDAAQAERLTRTLWRGELGEAAWAEAEKSTVPTVLLLRGQAAFLLACLTGDQGACEVATAKVAVAEQACAAVAASTWTAWAGSWVGLGGRPTPAQELASGQLALSLLLKGILAGMQQQQLGALLALRRAYATFCRLSPSVPAVQPLRGLGLGLYGLLLSFLPGPVGRLVALTQGGGAPASEEEATAMLQAAGRDPGCAACGAGWMPQVAAVLFLNAKAHLTQGAAAARRAEQDAALLAALAALEGALPGSLVFEWVGATVLRRLGDLDGALDRLRRVVARAAREVETAELLACRLRFNEAQLLFATGRHAEAQPAFEALLAPPARFTAACMVCLHLAACLAVQRRPAEARAALAQLARRAQSSPGRLDAQLAQRARGWAARSDDALPLCALELGYMMGYLHQALLGAGEAGAARAAAVEAAARPALQAAVDGGALEPRLAARVVLGSLLVCSGDAAAARGHFEAVVRACEEDGADAAAFAALPDQWCLPFAQGELAKLLLASADGAPPAVAAELVARAQAALRGAARVPQRSYSFYSWLHSSLRQTRRRCAAARRRARAAAGEAPGEAGAEEEADGEEEAAGGGGREDLEQLRAQLDREEEREHRARQAVD